MLLSVTEMLTSWLQLVEGVLRPARPELEVCLREGELQRARVRALAEARTQALAECQRRIEAARAEIFAAGDGVVPLHMTELEREWRAAARSADADGGLMELWSRIAPPAWIDRKRWRDSDASAQLDAALALAADVPGVEAAEAAIAALRVALVPWQTRISSRIAWRAFDADSDCVSALLAAPLQHAHETVVTLDAGPRILERAEQLERAVQAAALARFPERPLLAQALARAAFVDALLRAAPEPARPNPVTPLRALWQTGYALASVSDSAVTLEIPGW